MPRADLIWPKTGSTMCLRAAYRALPAAERSLCSHLLLRTRLSRGRRRLRRHRRLVVLLPTDGEVRVHAHLLQALEPPLR